MKIRVNDVLPTVSDEAIKVELTDATKDCTAGLGCTLSFLHEVIVEAACLTCPG